MSQVAEHKEQEDQVQGVNGDGRQREEGATAAPGAPEAGVAGADGGGGVDATQAEQTADPAADAAAGGADGPEAAAREADDADDAESAGEPMAEQYEQSFRVLTPGEIIEGKVVEVGDDEVLVDVGYKSEGRIPLNELGLRAGQTPRDVVREGETIDVQVLKVDDTEGTVLLSRKRAQYRQSWKMLEELHRTGQPIEARVTERVKGGLLVDVGVRGFVPASHVDRNFVENLDQYVGQTFRMKVLEIDRQRNNVVLSRKQLLEEEYEQAKAETFATLEEGAVVDGVVRRLTDFGAFVDIGNGVEGLLHVSELAWSRVRHPADVLHEGQEVRVKVLKIDREHERISLSLKETLPDPWGNIEERYQVDDVLKGTVTRVVDFGAFVKLEDGVEGLVHISQLADRHVQNPNEVVSPGSEVMVKVISLDPKARRIGLSIREAQRHAQPAPEPEDTNDGIYSTASSDQSGGETVQLGDVHSGLSELFEKMKAEEKKDNG